MRIKIAGEQRARPGTRTCAREVFGLLRAFRPRSGEGERKFHIGVRPAQFARFQQEGITIERLVDSSLAQRFDEESNIEDRERETGTFGVIGAGA